MLSSRFTDPATAAAKSPEGFQLRVQCDTNSQIARGQTSVKPLDVAANNVKFHQRMVGCGWCKLKLVSKAPGCSAIVILFYFTDVHSSPKALHMVSNCFQMSFCISTCAPTAWRSRSRLPTRRGRFACRCATRRQGL